MCMSREPTRFGNQIRYSILSQEFFESRFVYFQLWVDRYDSVFFLFISLAKDQLVYKVSYAPNVCIDTESSPIVVNHLQPASTGITDIYRERSITAALPNATLGPLQFSCRYTIQVQPLRIRPVNRWIKKQINIGDDQHLLTSCFCTPSCLKLITQPQYESTNLRCFNRGIVTIDLGFWIIYLT